MGIRWNLHRHDEEGFTLIELLVVIVVIGLLAAIAIPVFLGQRTRAYDGTAKTDVRNIATAEEAYLTNHGSYGSFAAIAADGQSLKVSHDVTVKLVRLDGVNGYCLAAQHAGSSEVWYYDSESGGLQSKGTAACPVTTNGLAGDQLTG
jgi:type IV pilus assembly protein PilA